MNIIIEFHIKEIRMQKGISIRKLSEITEISKTYLSNVENGHYMPSIYILCKIAVALDVSAEKLYSYKVQ